MTISIALVLSLLPTGLAHAAPSSSPPSSESARVQVDQLADGKSRLKITMPERLAGKTVVIRSARIIDGTRWTVVLGKAKVRSSGKVVLITSRTVRVQDRVIVQDKRRNVFNESIVAIGKPESSPKTPGAGSGGSSDSGAANTASPGQSAEAAAKRFIENGGDPNSAAYLNLVNYIGSGGSTGQLDELLNNLDTVLRCGSGGTCPELGTPNP